MSRFGPVGASGLTITIRTAAGSIPGYNMFILRNRILNVNRNFRVEVVARISRFETPCRGHGQQQPNRPFKIKAVIQQHNKYDCVAK